jgi:hypothetical protein
MDRDSIVQPLFPDSYIIFKDIDIDHDQILEELKKFNYVKLPELQTGATKSNKIFKSMKSGNKLKKVLEHYVRNAVKDILQYDIDVSLINMWGTETSQSATGTPHLHKNYWYSCCYYPHGGVTDDFKIKFFSRNLNHYDIPVSKFNVFNSGNWEQPITRGDLIIFPAHVLHQICLNNSKNTRYSIAANFLPKGKIGERDGELILT